MSIDTKFQNMRKMYTSMRFKICKIKSSISGQLFSNFFLGEDWSWVEPIHFTWRGRHHLTNISDKEFFEEYLEGIKAGYYKTGPAFYKGKYGEAKLLKGDIGIYR